MKNRGHVILAIIGLATAVLGLVLALRGVDGNRFLTATPYIMLGVGCGIFGHGMGRQLALWSRKRDPEGARKLDIEAGDERNVAISQRAKAKAFDLMLYVFSGVMLVFAWIGVEVFAVLLLVGAYLVVIGYGVYCRVRFDREM